MKRTFIAKLATPVLMGAILLMVGCQKAPESTRIGSSGARSNGLNPSATTTSTGVTISGMVVADERYQTQFQQAVGDFLSGSLDPQNVGFVSAVGAQQTGVYVGGHVELANGQPVGAAVNGKIEVTPSSELLTVVYDKFSDQQNLAPIPPIYLRSGTTGYVTGNQFLITFRDAYGTVTLDGQFDNNVAVMTFSFETTKTFDGKGGYGRENLGQLRIPKCQFFRCQ